MPAPRRGGPLAVHAQLGARVRVNGHVPVGRRRRGADRLAHAESVQSATALLHREAVTRLPRARVGVAFVHNTLDGAVLEGQC